MPYNDISLRKEDFDIALLKEHTNFNHSQTFEETVHELYDWLFHQIMNN